MVNVHRVSARAVLDDSSAALTHAKAQAAAGDESWEQWVAEYQRGDALIVRLELTLELTDGAAEVVTASQDGFFVEHRLHAPQLEQQIAELASEELVALGEELAQHGHRLDVHELGTMYVHVELDPEVRRRLHDHGALFP